MIKFGLMEHTFCNVRGLGTWVGVTIDERSDDGGKVVGNKDTGRKVYFDHTMLSSAIKDIDCTKMKWVLSEKFTRLFIESRMTKAVILFAVDSYEGGNANVPW